MANNRDFLNPNAQTATLASNSRLTGHAKLPAAEPFVPSTGLYFRGIRQLYQQAGGEGAIKFNDAIAAESRALSEKFQRVSNGLEVNELLTSVETGMIQTQQRLEKEQPENYTEKISSTFDSLSQEALGKCSNSDVQNILQERFLQSKYDHVRQAFAKENAMIVAKTTREVEGSLDQLSIYALQNPENFENYRQQLKTILAPMKEILPDSDYKSYEKTADCSLIYCYGMGIINKDPYTASKMLDGELFRSNLKPDQFTKLQKNARLEIDSRTKQEKARESAEQEAINKERVTRYTTLKGEVEIGNINDSDIDKAYTNNEITEKQRIQLINDYNKKQKAQKEKDEAIKRIIENIDYGESQEDIPENYQNQFMAENMMRRRQRDKKYTLTAAANEAIACKFTKPLKCLRDEIENAVYGGDAVAVMDAIAATNMIRKEGKGVFIRGMGAKYFNFIDSIQPHFTTDANINKKIIETARNKYFSPDTVTTEINKANIENQIKAYPEKLENSYKDFIKECDTSGILERNHDTYNLKDNKRLEYLFTRTCRNKYIYERCDDLDEAIKLTKKQMSYNIQESAINGKREIMYKPFDKGRIAGGDKKKANEIIGRALSHIENLYQNHQNKNHNLPIRKKSDREIYVTMGGKDVEKPVYIDYDFSKDNDFREDKYVLYYMHEGERYNLIDPTDDENFVIIDKVVKGKKTNIPEGTLGKLAPASRDIDKIKKIEDNKWLTTNL